MRTTTVPTVAAWRFARLELEADAYAGLPVWTSDAAWVLNVKVVYAVLWPRVRPLMSETVSLKAITAVAAAMASHADFGTGRNSRATNAQLMELTGYSLSVVQRAKAALRLMGVATEVMRGRQRTYEERMASWRLGIKSRGWASVWALHLPRPTPHLRSGRFYIDPLAKSVVTRGNTGAAGGKDGGTPCHSPDKRGRSRRRRPAPNPKGTVLAAQWLRAAQTPEWARRHTPEGWSRTLRRAAEHGWTPGDLNQLIAEHMRGKNTYSLAVRNPLRFVATILKRHDNYGDRPAYYIELQAAQEVEAARQRIAAQLAQRDARRASDANYRAAGGPDRRSSWRQFKPKA